MWKNRYFSDESSAREWMKAHDHLYVMSLVYLDKHTPKSPGCMVEYKPLRRI